MTEGLNNTEVKEYIVLPVICPDALLSKFNFYVVMRCILESKSFDIRQKSKFVQTKDTQVLWWPYMAINILDWYLSSTF